MSARHWPVSRARTAPTRLAVVVLTVLTLMLANPFGPALTAATSPGFAMGDSVVVATDRLNLRASPSIGATILYVLEQGDVMRVTDGPEYADGYSWYELETWMASPVAGWAAGEYLALVADDGSGDHLYQIGDTVAVDTPRLNGRTGPGLGYAVDQVLQSGAQAVVIDGPVHADGYQWYQIQLPSGDVVWAIGEGLTASGGYEDPGFEFGDTATVATDALNLRLEPNCSALVIRVLPEGTAVKVVGGPAWSDGYTWYKVVLTASGTLGWVAGEYLA